MKKYILSILCFLALNLQAQTYTPTKANVAARTTFQDNKFGMFIHWGDFSVLGDGEWVMETKGINKVDYKKVIKLFNTVYFDAGQEMITHMKQAEQDKKQEELQKAIMILT